MVKQELLPAVLSDACEINNWHQADALPALIGGIRFYKLIHLEYNKIEGIVYCLNLDFGIKYLAVLFIYGLIYRFSRI